MIFYKLKEVYVCMCEYMCIYTYFLNLFFSENGRWESQDISHRKQIGRVYANSAQILLIFIFTFVYFPE